MPPNDPDDQSCVADAHGTRAQNGDIPTGFLADVALKPANDKVWNCEM